MSVTSLLCTPHELKMLFAAMVECSHRDTTEVCAFSRTLGTTTVRMARSSKVSPTHTELQPEKHAWLKTQPVSEATACLNCSWKSCSDVMCSVSCRTSKTHLETSTSEMKMVTRYLCHIY